MAIFPQINSNLILTQLPYSAGVAFETVATDMETGMRWSFPRRGGGISGYPGSALGRFGINFSSITDSEVDVLESFFESMRGRWAKFSLLDPGGNLVQHSEDYSEAYWNKSNGPVTIGGTGITDPFGGTLATALVGNGSNAYIMGLVGPSAGGINGYRLCASTWAKTPDSGIQLMIGFMNSTGTVFRSTTWDLPPNKWIRIYHSETMWDTNSFRVIIGGLNTWASGRTINLFGAQVAAMKGEGAYVRSPDRWGYHEYCRFDVDAFSRRVLGPNQNAVNLPIVEVNG